MSEDSQDDLVLDWFRSNYDEGLEGIDGVSVDSSFWDRFFPPNGGNVVYLVLSEPIDIGEFASIVEGDVESDRYDSVRLKVDVKDGGSECDVRRVVEEDGQVSSIRLYGSSFEEGDRVGLSRGEVIFPGDGEPVDSSVGENLDVLVRYLEGKYKD